MTESQWAGNCTTPTFDATGIPSSVSSGVNIPQWAFLPNVGDSWSPSYASAAAVSGGLNTAIPSATAANPYSYSYNDPYTYGDYPYNIGGYYAAATTAWAIYVGVLAGIYALMIIIGGIVYYIRQKRRRAWYGPMAQYYRQRGVGGYQGNYAAGGSYQPPFNSTPYNPGAGAAGVPLLYQNEANMGAQSPHAKHASLYGSSASPAPSTQYQPPPPEANPFSTPYATPNEIQYQPPPQHGTGTGSFGGPPQGPPQGPPPGAGYGAGYRGHAEAY